MKKVFLKVFIIIFIALIAISSISKCYGMDDLINGMDPGGNINDVLGGAGSSATKKVQIISGLFTTLQIIGTGISIIMVSKLGISYMMSSVDEKAEIKKRAVPIVIGSVLIVATVNILKIVQNIVSESLLDTNSSDPTSNPPSNLI